MSLRPVRRRSHAVTVGGVAIGGDNPIRIQSMTDTDTADISSTVKQVLQLAKAGSELVRMTVNVDAAAKAVPHIRDQVRAAGCDVPLIGDFHYNGHTLLADNPDCAAALDKYRINPGNVGFGKKRDVQFAMIVEQALKHDKPVRIGVNWGSLDQALLAQMMDANAKAAAPKTSAEILQEALIQSALLSCDYAKELGMRDDQIIVACKVSDVQQLISLYQDMAARCEYALHLGLTEAGMGSKGIVATTAALAVLLQQGIGDTIRCSLTPEPGAARTQEVLVCQQILQAMGIRDFLPVVSSCPGCGRTTSSYFRELAQTIQQQLSDNMAHWRADYPGVESLKVAVMGCIVNGPGESKHADIGISLPGTGEQPVAPVFIDGKKAATLRGDNIAAEFMVIIEQYVQEKYGILTPA